MAFLTQKRNDFGRVAGKKNGAVLSLLLAGLYGRLSFLLAGLYGRLVCDAVIEAKTHKLNVFAGGMAILFMFWRGLQFYYYFWCTDSGALLNEQAEHY